MLDLNEGRWCMNQLGARTGPFGWPNLLPDERLGFRLAQLRHPVQYMARDPCLPLLRFVVARTKAVSERPLVPEKKILDGALSSIT